MSERKWNVEERDALVKLGLRMQALHWEYPSQATRTYHTCEVYPAGVLTADVVRQLIRTAFVGMLRADELEEFAEKNIAINGVPFLQWEADPSIATRYQP